MHTANEMPVKRITSWTTWNDGGIKYILLEQLTWAGFNILCFCSYMHAANKHQIINITDDWACIMIQPHMYP